MQQWCFDDSMLVLQSRHGYRIVIDREPGHHDDDREAGHRDEDEAAVEIEAVDGGRGVEAGTEDAGPGAGHG